MKTVKGYRLYVELNASQVRRRLKGHGFGVRKVESAGSHRAVIIHTATGQHLRQLEVLFRDVLEKKKKDEDHDGEKEAKPPPMNEPPSAKPAMTTVGQVIEFVQERLGHIFERPLMYGGTAEGVDMILHYYYELWAAILGRNDDFHRIRIEVYEEGGSGTLGYQARRDKPNATEQELCGHVVGRWKRIGQRLKMSVV